MKKEVYEEVVDTTNEVLQDANETEQTISPEELEEIQATLTKADKLKYSLADLTIGYELNKAEILEQLKVSALEIETISQGLNTKYGKVRVDISTGVITQE